MKAQISQNYEDNDDEVLCGNLNINQEIDIIANPKKYQVTEMKKKIKRSSFTMERNKFPKISKLERRASIEANTRSKRLSKNFQLKRFCKKYITPDDIYLSDEIFVSSPSSYPGDYEKDNKIIEMFCEDYKDSCSDCDSNSDDSNEYDENINENIDDINNNSNENNKIRKKRRIRNNSFSYPNSNENIINLRFISPSKNCKLMNNNLIVKSFNCELKYEDEEEEINKNIGFLSEDKLKEITYYSSKNKCNISFISVNLFIKKIAVENLKNNFPILYKSFITQFSGFLSISFLIEHLIQAFNYYYNLLNIETPDLIDLLNNVISKHFTELNDANNNKNQELIQKLRKLYNILDSNQNKNWMSESLKKSTESVSFLLSSSDGEDFDIEYTKYFVEDRKRNKAVAVRNRGTRGARVNPKNMKKKFFNIFDFTEEEIARTLTFITFKLMSNIELNELWYFNFNETDKHKKAPNVMKLVERFDKLILFIIEDICSYDEIKVRAELITKWAKIADKCKQLKNFNDALIIVKCLSNSCLKKMAISWNKVPDSTLSLIGELNKFFSPQNCYINIRRAVIKSKGTAYIPYLGILLQEIIDIEEKYKYMLNQTNINCVKIQKIYYSVQKFFSFKNFSFSFKEIKDLSILNNINPLEEKEIENLISEIEPKAKIKAERGEKKRMTKTDKSFYSS